MLRASLIDPTFIKLELVNEFDHEIVLKINDFMKELARVNFVIFGSLEWQMHISMIPLLQRGLNNIGYLKREMTPELKAQLDAYRYPKFALDFDPAKPLREFQKEGIAFFLSRRFAIIGDDPGLGKSVQAAMAIFQKLLQAMNASENKLCLAIVPSSVIFKWKREFRKFLNLTEQEANELIQIISNAELTKKELVCQIKQDRFFRRRTKICKKCALFSKCLSEYARINYGTAAKRRQNLFLERRPFTFITYELARLDIDWLLAESGIHYNFIVIDEIHRLRNSETQQSKAVFRLTENAEIVCGLTGTIIQGQLSHFYHVIKGVDRRFFGSERNFYERYLVFNEWGKVVAHKNEEEISLRLPFVFLRRTKEDVQEQLPKEIEDHRDVVFSSKEREIYQAINDGELELAADPARAAQINNLHDSEYGPRVFLEQACDSLELISPLDFPNFNSSKLYELATDLDELCPNHKVVVYTKYSRMIKIICNRFSQYNPVNYDGSKNQLAKQQTRDEFIFDPTRRLFVMNSAGKEGMDLHGDFDKNNRWVVGAEVIIFFDITWNEKEKQQIKDRIHRLGATSDSILIISYGIQDTVEDAMWRRHDDQAALFERMVNTVPNWEQVYDI